MSEAKVDFVVVGIGHPSADFSSTRFNAGYTFADYLANCVAMQSVLLSQGDQEAIAKGEMSIPSDFRKPIFQRVTALGGTLNIDANLVPVADVNDSLFALTEADLHTGPKSTVRPGAETVVKVCGRVD